MELKEQMSAFDESNSYHEFLLNLTTRGGNKALANKLLVNLALCFPRPVFKGDDGRPERRKTRRANNVPWKSWKKAALLMTQAVRGRDMPLRTYLKTIEEMSRL